MAKTATKNPETKVLGEYRGAPITSATGKFTNLGDGLSKSMEIEGGIDEQNELVTFVVRCAVSNHNLTKDEDTGENALEHTYKGLLVARIDDDLVAFALNSMEQRIKERADALNAQPTMPGVDEAATAAKTATSRGKGGLKSVPDDEEHFDIEAPEGE